MNASQTLKKNMRELMRRTGLDSQPKVAKASGVSQTQVGAILRGDKSPTLETLVKLAAGFRVPTFALLMDGASSELELLEAYYACEAEGRQVVLSVAKAQAGAVAR